MSSNIYGSPCFLNWTLLDVAPPPSLITVPDITGRCPSPPSLITVPDIITNKEAYIRVKYLNVELEY